MKAVIAVACALALGGCASGPYQGSYSGYAYSDNSYSYDPYGAGYYHYPGTISGSIFFHDHDGRDRWSNRYQGDRDWRDRRDHGRDRDARRDWDGRRDRDARGDWHNRGDRFGRGDQGGGRGHAEDPSARGR